LGCENLKANSILVDQSHRIQIVDIIPNWIELHNRENSDESTRKANGVMSEFVAPEVLSGRKLTQKADVVAFALILCSIVVGHRPLTETAERSGRAERPLIVRHAFQGFVPDFVSRRILSGLPSNPNDRPSFNNMRDSLTLPTIAMKYSSL
jgi:hypothetical protein